MILKESMELEDRIMAVKALLDDRIEGCKRANPEAGQLTLALDQVNDRISGVEHCLNAAKKKHSKQLNEACSMVEDIS